MRRTICLIICLTIVSISFWGCGGSGPSIKTEKDLNIPDWYLNPPADPDHIWAVGDGYSSDMGLAKEKAATAARTSIAKEQDVKLSNLTKSFKEEIIGANDAVQLLDQFTIATKEVVQTTLRGAKQVETAVTKEGRMFRVYVLFSYPTGAAAEALLNNLGKNEELYTRFRASKAFEELNQELEVYKKEQGQ